MEGRPSLPTPKPRQTSQDVYDALEAQICAIEQEASEMIRASKCRPRLSVMRASLYNADRFRLQKTTCAKSSSPPKEMISDDFMERMIQQAAQRAEHDLKQMRTETCRSDDSQLADCEVAPRLGVISPAAPETLAAPAQLNTIVDDSTSVEPTEETVGKRPTLNMPNLLGLTHREIDILLETPAAGLEQAKKDVKVAELKSVYCNNGFLAIKALAHHDMLSVLRCDELDEAAEVAAQHLREPSVVLPRNKLGKMDLVKALFQKID